MSQNHLHIGSIEIFLLWLKYILKLYSSLRMTKWGGKGNKRGVKGKENFDKANY